MGPCASAPSPTSTRGRTATTGSWRAFCGNEEGIGAIVEEHGGASAVFNGRLHEADHTRLAVRIVEDDRIERTFGVPGR